MKFINHLLIAALISFFWAASSIDCYAQRKFEFSVNIDPIIIPINFGTYVESGPGHYDINGRTKISQAAYANFTYWTFNSVGFSVGAGLRNFKTLIDYSIPSPYAEVEGDLPIQGFYPFSAKGWGLGFGLHFRKGKWSGSFGLTDFDLFKLNYNSTSRFAAVTVFNSDGVVLGEVEIEEEAYWDFVPNFYTLYQFNGKYNLTEHFFLKLGFEATLQKGYYPVYTLEASGFTEHTSPEEQLLNDYAAYAKISAFSLGVGYKIGFGKFKYLNEEKMDEMHNKSGVIVN